MTAGADPEPSLGEPIIGTVNTVLSLTQPTDRRDAVTRSNAAAVRIVFSPVEPSTYPRRRQREPLFAEKSRAG
jgi:hypothetical protein